LPESDLDLLTEAAALGAEIALGYWKTDQTVWHKHADAGPVSEGDYAVDAALRDHLTAARPGYGWLSEETPDTPERLGRDRVFIVDPIDGTRAYVDGRESWALSLAVVEAGRPVAAVVQLPAKGLLYAAERGGGAHLNGAPIAASTRQGAEGATLLASRAALDPRHWPDGVPRVERVFRPSLAYRLCLVAEGRFDAMLTLRDSWEWDIAAGALIVEEAGGAVTDRTGRPLAFNSAGGHTPGVLVAAAGVHGALLSGLAA
jgi:myo-inositol-1(or 4)-monophosphatase